MTKFDAQQSKDWRTTAKLRAAKASKTFKDVQTGRAPTNSGSIHPFAERARSESVVVNGVLYRNGVGIWPSTSDDVWFPIDHPEALGLTKIRDELESLIIENHRILDEIAASPRKRLQIKIKPVDQDLRQDLQQSLEQIDRKYNNEIDRMWQEFHKRQALRTAVDTRTTNELDHAFPQKRSYKWVRVTAGLLSLAAIVGSAVYFLL